MKPKSMLAVALALLLMGATSAIHADEWDDALRGGLIGASIGVIVGNHSGDLRVEEAVPLFAASGALLGYAWNQRHRNYDGDYYYPYDYYDHPYGRGHYDPYDDRRYWRGRPYHQKQPRPVAVSRQPTTNTPSPAPANPHPGVTLVTVAVPLPSGTSVNLRLLKMPDRYVGPQGETYTNLPSAEELAARYVPSAP